MREGERERERESLLHVYPGKVEFQSSLESETLWTMNEDLMMKLLINL